jgi:hypothetical protein
MVETGTGTGVVWSVLDPEVVIVKQRYLSALKTEVSGHGRGYDNDSD